jgi:UDP-N-acetylglucosamine--N-acetylmuramyl-(pentapeptide) pyrophosphoryl-undecaprenol N-acetylglucosamine transferase
MAGGTGGHVMPGLAVAQAMRERAWDVVWTATRPAWRQPWCPRTGSRCGQCGSADCAGKGLKTRLMLPVNLLRAFWQSLAAIRSVRPAVVLGLGGYISFPGGMMAALLGRPLVLHEQNSIAGLANRVLARVADRVLGGLPRGLARGGTVAGNPVRADIAALDEPATRYGLRTGPLRLLVLGGSLGARALNEAMPQALAMLPEADRPTVVHQSGRAHLEALRDGYARAGVAAQVIDFIEDMATAYRDTDLVICRAARDDGLGSRRRGRGQPDGAVSARGRRPPDHQRALPVRPGARRC